MKVLALTRYARLGASSRVRMMQYGPYLAAAGLTVETSPFFDDAYLEALYAGGPRAKVALAAYGRRLGRLIQGAGANLVWMEKELLPWCPWPVEGLLRPRGVPLVTDYDDAVFHRYDRHPNPLVRAVLGRKIDRVMAASSLVVAGNDYLAQRARAAGARRVEIVPTVVDADAYAAVPAMQDPARPRLGWIGLPETWAKYLRPMLPHLTATAARHGAVLRVVGAGQDAEGLDGVESVAWTEATEIAEIARMDIGLMPLDASPWSQGKCGYKLIQYMACGLPVVASPVGVNRALVTHGENGFLAETPQDWADALSRLLADPELRVRMGAAGRARVQAGYSLQAQGPRLAGLLREIAARHHAKAAAERAAR